MSSISGFRPASYKSGTQSSFTATGTGLPNPATVNLSETTLGGVTWAVVSSSVTTSTDGTTVVFNATPSCHGATGTGNLNLSLGSLVTMTLLNRSQPSTYT